MEEKVADTEFQLIEKDQKTLIDKIEKLDAEINLLETNYFSRSETLCGGCNIIRGWEGFLDAKLDVNDRGRGFKVPQSERYFSNTSIMSNFSSGKAVGKGVENEDSALIKTGKNKSKGGQSSQSTSGRTVRKRKRY